MSHFAASFNIGCIHRARLSITSTGRHFSRSGILKMSATSTSKLDAKDVESFRKHLRYSDRIVALCGAGLSASSGLPTFRGAGGLWRQVDATSLATPEAFSQNPGLVWQFYSYRRHMALGVKPNAAHFALAELAKHKRGFQTLSQNVDGQQILALRE